jgi:hypothetical protein
MLMFLLGVEFNRQFGEDDRVVANRPLIGPALDLTARPPKPILIVF